ncbi:hypothetical protein, partial [Alteromonas genovensis]|uniref:hypothetical protein n=1 Tax=Alteromonas genovensis TaxID=471225 RepID=UPI0019427A86
FSCTPNKTLLALPPVAGTLTRGLARSARILAHVLAPQSLVLGNTIELGRFSNNITGFVGFIASNNTTLIIFHPFRNKHYFHFRQ